MKKPNENLIHAKNFACGITDQITLDGTRLFIVDLLDGYSKAGKLGAERKREKYPLSEDKKAIYAREYMRKRRAEEKKK